MRGCVWNLDDFDKALGFRVRFVKGCELCDLRSTGSTKRNVGDQDLRVGAGGKIKIRTCERDIWQPGGRLRRASQGIQRLQ